ncbi:peptide-methionine (S)-S-oxide reductase [Algibacter sp. Ld11]|uniref:peptide-methionine (S)-S-oxide reductase n=1 Tax=Algibacter sp. Ld11 TaxID=649150 RepID=UPI0038663527
MGTHTKIALGGGCHWCTEAVFQSLKGVDKVEQGYVSSLNQNNTFSEAVIIHFYEDVIPLEVLVEIHLHTHKSTSNHSMRDKYRSAIYTFSEAQEMEAITVLKNFNNTFEKTIITEVLPFSEFKASREAIQNYYKKNPEKPFCKQFINPKLKLLVDKFSKYVI